MTDPRELIRSVLVHLGEDPERDGLRGTPDRVVRSWTQLYAGYQQDPANILKVDFDLPHTNMVTIDHITVFSTCEHHLLPFWGEATISYIPNGARVVGASKLARLVDCFARRLQIQERLTDQIADAIVEHLKPVGVGVVIRAKHFCITSRGVQKERAEMETRALRGKIYDNAVVRAEFNAAVAR